MPATSDISNSNSDEIDRKTVVKADCARLLYRLRGRLHLEAALVNPLLAVTPVAPDFLQARDTQGKTMHSEQTHSPANKRPDSTATSIPETASATSDVNTLDIAQGIMPLGGADLGSAERVNLLKPWRAAAQICQDCRLCEKRKNVAFGEGNTDSDLLLIGEAPGREEDEQGRPFVGSAGKMLTKMIENVLARPRFSVYIANIVKCRPEGNRDPISEETAACRKYLNAQIEIIQPKVILLLGRVALNNLFGINVSISRCRGIWREYQGIPVLPIFHPSYLIRRRQENFNRTTTEDKLTLNDILQVKQKLLELS